MKDYMKEYIEKIDTYLVNDNNQDLEEVIEEHLIKIKFFMHERLVHFLVTMLFAILTIISFFFALEHISLGLVLLVLLFLALLIPYIFHYYYLENSVQYMYKQYDMLLLRRNNKKKK